MERTVALTELTYQMIYPECREVSGEQLRRWAQDLLAEEELQKVPAAETVQLQEISVEEAIEILSDAGEVTLGNYGKPVRGGAVQDSLATPQGAWDHAAGYYD